jgi:hypothetical protein
MWNSEYDMEVTRIKYFAASFIDPNLFEYRLTVRAVSIAA